jgi:hypothetical protein
MMMIRLSLGVNSLLNVTKVLKYLPELLDKSTFCLLTLVIKVNNFPGIGLLKLQAPVCAVNRG